MWARIEENVVMEITSINPKGRFHPDLVWKKCDETVKCYWTFVDGMFIAPMPVNQDEIVEGVIQPQYPWPEDVLEE